VQSWQRVRVANALAKNGAEWGAYLRYNNSGSLALCRFDLSLFELSFANTGTYNNQYMIIDLKVFQAGQQLQPGLLTIVEQIPGLVLFDDLTETLERGYWPRYVVSIVMCIC
jgi:hypothetical protein